jgi:peptidoglycan hydrolase-like protein with peptidoglycan-binding domain
MKYLISTLLLLAFIAPNVASATIDRNLKYGAKNDTVLQLQDYLQDKGYFNLSPTGYFGLVTLRAVKKFQADNNIPATGFVGPITRAFINEDFANISVVETESFATSTFATTTPETQNTSPIINTYTPIQEATPIVTITPGMVYNTTI